MWNDTYENFDFDRVCLYYLQTKVFTDPGLFLGKFTQYLKTEEW